MSKKERYTIVDSARDVAKEMIPGQMLPGWKICKKMRAKLKMHNVPGRPLDTVCLARFRDVRDLYRIKTVQGISEYTKELPEEDGQCQQPRV